MTNTKPAGVLYAGEFCPKAKRIFFMEAKGKDISFPRWRICLYYKSHLAATHFEYSQEAYDNFIAKNAGACYSDYAAFRNNFDLWQTEEVTA